MTQQTEEDPIVTAIDQDTIDAIISSPNKADIMGVNRKERAVNSVQDIIYNGAEKIDNGAEKSHLFSEEEITILRYAIEDAFERHKGDKRNVFNLPYINHSVSVARILYSQGEDLTTIIAGLLHDTIENQVENAIRKEVRRELLNAIETIEERASKKLYGKNPKKLNDAEKKRLRAETELDVEKVRQDIYVSFRRREEEIRSRYRTELIIKYRNALPRRGVSVERAEKLANNLDQILQGITRSYFEDYYQAIDEIMAPNPNISPKNKVRIIKVKFADCIANTEVVDDSLYSLESLLSAIEREDNIMLVQYEAITTKGMLRHRNERKTRIKGNKRVYRTFKNIFLTNSFRIYEQHIGISETLGEMIEKGMLETLLISEGFLDGIKELSRVYHDEKRISETRSKALRETVKNVLGLGDNAQSTVSPVETESSADKKDSYLNITDDGINRFITRCAKTGYFNHITSYAEAVEIVNRYLREQGEYKAHRQELQTYETLLITRNNRSAKTIIDHLVSYHSSKSQLPFERIFRMIKVNEQYRLDDGYNHITLPASRISAEFVDEDTISGVGTKVLINNGTRKTLETPDGIIMLFIDTKVKGDDLKLAELYKNKANMLWAALSSWTLGGLYAGDRSFILYGVDSEGIHQNAAIAKK